MPLYKGAKTTVPKPRAARIQPPAVVALGVALPPPGLEMELQPSNKEDAKNVVEAGAQKKEGENTTTVAQMTGDVAPEDVAGATVEKQLQNDLKKVQADMSTKTAVPAEEAAGFEAEKAQLENQPSVLQEEGQAEVLKLTAELESEKVMGLKIVKFDVENETPIRGADNFCQTPRVHTFHRDLFTKARRRLPASQAGARDIREDHPSKRFDGYTDAKATEKKVPAGGWARGTGLANVPRAAVGRGSRLSTSHDLGLPPSPGDQHRALGDLGDVGGAAGSLDFGTWLTNAQEHD